MILRSKKKFAKTFSNHIKQFPGYSLERSSQIYDFTLYHFQIPIAIVEVVSKLDIFRIGSYDAAGVHSRIPHFINFAKSQNIRFFILTDTNSYFLWDSDILIEDKFEDIDSIFLFISKNFDNKTTLLNENRIQNIADVILSCLRNYNLQSDKPVLILQDELVRGITVQGDIASFVPNRGLENDWQDLETRFFSELLGTSEVKIFYKYTTVDSAFTTLDTQKIRLNGVVGMNDTTETHYADSYVGGVVSYQTLSMNEVDALNRKFIYSCSASDDELTMWRLYADDCQGVSFKFSLTNEKSRSFIAKKVSYAKADGTHLQLDLIRNIMINLEKIGVKFVLRRFSVWKHFFKPFEYAIEKEVRILYLADQNADIRWCLTSSHKILNPFVLLPLNDIPAKLVEIKFGPKSAEVPTNLKQFESFVRAVISKLPYAISVDRSKISNYR